MTPTLKTEEKDRATPCRAVLFACLLTIGLASPLPDAAAADPSFSVSPVRAPGGKSYFVYESKPAKTISGRVSVVNTGGASGLVSLYPVDATTGQTSGAVYRSRQAPRREAGGWISLARKRLRLAPGEATEVPFRVRVPAGTDPGEHLAGIVAEKGTLKKGKTVKRNRGRFKINVRNLTVMAVQVNVPGPRVRKMVVEGVKSGGSQGGNQTVLVGLRNDGNTMVKPTLALTVTKGGRTVQDVKLKLDTFLPQTRIDYPVPVRERALGTGSYKASVVLDDGRGGVVRAEDEFSVSGKQVKQVFGKDSPLAQESGRSLTSYAPWLLVLLMGGYFLRTFLRKRGGSDGEAPADAQSGHDPRGDGGAGRVADIPAPNGDGPQPGREHDRVPVGGGPSEREG